MGVEPKIGILYPKMDGKFIMENPSVYIMDGFWGDFTHHLRKHPYNIYLHLP